MTNEPTTYRFADSHRPGLLLGLSARQATPILVGVLLLAVALQGALPSPIGVAGPIVGTVVAFGRWRGTPITELLIPGWALALRRGTGHQQWLQSASPRDDARSQLPRVLRGIEVIDAEPASTDRFAPFAVIHDKDNGTVSGVIRVGAQGFPLASRHEQDGMLAGWSSALTPFASDRSPVSCVTWQEWAHPVGSEAHADFLAVLGIHQLHDAASRDYLGLVQQQAPVTIAHDTLITVTVDLRKVRSRRGTTSRVASGIDALSDEVRLFSARLDAAGMTVELPLTSPELSTSVRVRSDPRRSTQSRTLRRSLAATVHRSAIEWGPTVVEPEWSHVRVDGAYHRSYRVTSWPQLPVASDWLGALITGTTAVRTVTVVLEPVPIRRAARAADREVMAREADADMKSQKGFRVNAQERKRLADVETRERELSQGHVEFQFVGLVNVTAGTLDELDDACADVEQAAAQCLLDLRPLDARHEQGWVASLPLGRAITRRST